MVKQQLLSTTSAGSRRKSRLRASSPPITTTMTSSTSSRITKRYQNEIEENPSHHPEYNDTNGRSHSKGGGGGGGILLEPPPPPVRCSKSKSSANRKNTISPKTLLWCSALLLLIWGPLKSFLDTSNDSSNEWLLSQGGARQVQKDGPKHQPYIIADPSVLMIRDPAELAWDPFATAPRQPQQQEQQQQEQQQQQHDDNNNDEETSKPNKKKKRSFSFFGAGNDSQEKQSKDFWRASNELRELFEEEYGTYGRSMLTKSVQTVYNNNEQGSSLSENKNKIQSLVRALQHRNELNIVVLGNGAAAGYGNFRRQAYSVQLDAFLEAIIPKVTITNLAVHQGTEFPMVWCLESHFLQINQQQQQQQQQQQPDMVIYDFTGSTPRRMEAVARQLLLLGVAIFVARYSSTHLPPQPFLDMLKRYCPMEDEEEHVTPATVASFQACLWLEPQTGVEPYLLQPTIPPGLKGWQDEFGTGRKPVAYHDLDHLDHQLPKYLTVPQHRWIAWSITMPLLSALQQVHQQHSTMTDIQTVNQAPRTLPLPLLLDHSLDPLVRGDPSSIQCYTSYEYVVRNSDMTDLEEKKLVLPTHHRDVHIPANLPSVIRSPIVGTSQQLLKPKVVVQHNAAWSYDLDIATKRYKQQMQHNHNHQAFYGMPDWKGAYYGAYQSGVLELSLPVHTQIHDDNSDSKKNSFVSSILRGHRRPILGKNASAYIQGIILCQSDAPMTDNVVGCSWAKDVQVRLGGAVAAKSNPLDSSFRIVVSTRGGTRNDHVQPLCRRVFVPSNATLVMEGNDLTLPIEIQVTNPHILWHPTMSVPCSLSHILVDYAKQQQ